MTQMLTRRRDFFEATDQPLSDAEVFALRRQINSPLLQRCLRTIADLRREVDTLQERLSKAKRI